MQQRYFGLVRRFILPTKATHLVLIHLSVSWNRTASSHTCHMFRNQSLLQLPSLQQACLCYLEEKRNSPDCRFLHPSASKLETSAPHAPAPPPLTTNLLNQSHAHPTLPTCRVLQINTFLGPATERMALRHCKTEPASEHRSPAMNAPKNSWHGKMWLRQE